MNSHHAYSLLQKLSKISKAKNMVSECTKAADRPCYPEEFSDSRSTIYRKKTTSYDLSVSHCTKLQTRHSKLELNAQQH